MILNEESAKDTNRRQFAIQFNTDQCLAGERTSSVAECLTAREVYIFCPYVLFFGHRCFCAHPERDAIIENTNRLIREANADEAASPN